jgi:hypothetical protein
MGSIRISDIPDKTIRRLSLPLHNYSTALFRVTGQYPRNLTPLHIGSGSFVSVGQTNGVLTAQHVADKLGGPCWLGLSAAREGEEHQMIVDRHSILLTDLGAPLTEEFGPDLSFIALANWHDVTTIKSSRAFLPLETDREMLLNDPPSVDRGIWFLSGAPEERLHLDTYPQRFHKVVTYENLCLAAGPTIEVANGDFDYFELDVDQSETVPSSFAGMSGGGLWRVLVARPNNGDFVPTRYLLTGVVFYQGVRENGTRFVRCHGRRSVYEKIFTKVLGQYA